MSNKTRFVIRYLFVVFLGVLLHFTYELSGENPIVGLFAPVNESTWEHLKLLFTPMLLLTIRDLFTGYQKSPNFLPARVTSIIAGLLFIIVVFYTVTGIIGNVIDWINIVIFLLSVLIVFWAENKILHHNKHGSKLLNTTSAIIVFIVLTLLFVVFTIVPLNIGLFQPL